MSAVKTIAPLVFFLAAIHPGPGETCFKKYSNPAYRFSILIPANWQKKETDLGYTHILILNHRSAEIKITAALFNEKDNNKWDNWKEWYTHSIGNSLIEIVDTGSVQIRQGIEGKLFVFEYLSPGGIVLQRLLNARINDNYVIIECRARMADYYNFNPVFERVMSSLEPL